MTQRFVKLVTVLAVLVCASAAAAEMPMPTSATPTLYGAQVLPKGDMVLGLTTGYPATTFDMYWGLPSVDLGLHIGLTYGGRLSGLAQRFGMEVLVPMRWMLVEQAKWAAAFKFTPVLMLGEVGPSFTLGGDLGVLFDIPLPKVFKLILGPELRTALATPGSNAGYFGSLWINLGIETLIAREFFVGLLFKGGGAWFVDGGPGRGVGTGGMFNALIYGGMKF